MELQEIAIHAHLQENGIKTEDGSLLDFRDHMFMFDVYEDMASLERDIVCYKAAQITFSTTAINALLWIVKNKKIDAIYTLPTVEDVRQFSGGKINRIVAQNPVYQEWVKDKDTVEHKIVGENIVYFRGTHTSKSATMVSSDLNVYDEIDSSNQDTISQYETRLQHSKLKRQWYFSHPSVPGNGVAKHWDKSDKKKWAVRCDYCNKEQFLNFPQCIDDEYEIFQCAFCHSYMSDNVRRRGRWVVTNKKGTISGYWIPLLICPWVSAADILKYQREKEEDYFVNKVLGLPYVGGGNKVTQDYIYQNLTPEVNKQEGRIVIGVDPGIDIRYVIGNRDGLFFYGQCNTYDDLAALMDKWPRAVMVIDQGGDIIGSRLLREKYPGRVFLCHYIADRKTMQLIRWGEKDESGNVQVDRNRMIQLVIDEFKDKRIPLQYVDNREDWHDYWLHWSHIYRETAEDAQLRKRYVWKRSDRDDWVHATVYWRVGMDRFGSKGSIVGGKIEAEPNSYMVTLDQKTSVNPLRKVVKATYEPPENNDWRD